MRAASKEAKKTKERGQAWRLVGFRMTVDSVVAMLNEGAAGVRIEDIISLKAGKSLRAIVLKSPETQNAAQGENVHPMDSSGRRPHRFPEASAA
jgi:hypothetical protein